MNRIYRSIWSHKTATFVAVSEHVKSGGKSSPGSNTVMGARFALKTLTASLLLAFGSTAYALPTGGTLAAGSAGITNGNGSMTINQSSQNAVLNWNSFNIGQGESVRFVQPNSNSVALNRVLGSDPSRILGSLSANGKVFLVNPNGILFGKGAQVNVSGLAASTLDISDSDFMAGRYRFAGGSNGSVANQGTINADAGYVALLGANVSNQGTINAKLGTVALAAGRAVTLDVAGDGLLNVTVDEGAVNALAQNSGLIQADGGQVLMTAQAAGALLQTAVNNTGVIRAQTIENHGGVIKLLGDMQGGTVNVGGTLDASAPDGGNGGFIDTSAARVNTASDARIITAAAHGLTGSWLIDPVDYTIAASGGDITGATLSANLDSTDITILSTSGGTGTNGDVNVNDTVAWSANKLTLNAQNNININTAMNASGTASLALQYGQNAVAAGNTSKVNVHAPVNLPAGNNFSTTLGSDGTPVNYTVITSLGAAGSTTGTDLQGMNGNLAGNYVLGTNIDAAATSGWNSGGGFSPVIGSEPVTMGSYTYTNLLPFTGIFDGLGHTISGLTINQPTVSNLGMFGLTSSTSMIRNVGLMGGSVTGAYITGALVAENHGSINNSYATGSVAANMVNSLYVGGLAGSNFGSISDSYATGTVSGQRSVGGLVGTNGTQGGSSIGSITKSYSTGAVTAGTYSSGGLAGNNEAGSSIIDSYATGAVTGGKNGSGGLVGANYGSISTSYATGAVTNTQGYVGGLVGSNGYGTGSITLSYSSGAVSGGNHLGGLAGANFGQASAISNSYWNKDTSDQATSGGGTGLTTVEMQTGSNFAGFNFTTTPGATGNNWVMIDVDGTLNNAGGALGATRPMLASEYSTTINNVHQLQLMALNMAANYTLGKNINAAATGAANDVWSGSTFIPVGIGAFNTFTGVFDGLGHTINGLTINRPGTDYAGLFRVLRGTVRNVGLVGGSTNGGQFTGALVGRNYGTISNSYATGTVSGTSNVGGLVGFSNSGTISDSYATGAVTGSSYSVGGLAGGSYGTMSNSYATGNVSGNRNVGGLVGGANGNGVNNSYATGTVSGSTYVGGLVGYNAATTSNSYATGAVSGSNSVGGLVGYNNGTISKTYATGAVTGTTRVGGLVGFAYGTSSNSFWDTTTSGQASSAGGGLGMTTAQMMTQANFMSATAANGGVNPAWDTTSTWIIYDGHTAPLLRTFMTSLTVTANNADKTYDGAAYSGGNGATYSITPNGDLLGTLDYSGNSQGAVNAGSYNLTPEGLYSTNQQGGYAINFVSGTLTVDKKVLTATVAASGKTYDGTTTAAPTLTITGGLVGAETVNATGTASFNSKDVATANLVTVDSTMLADGSNGGLAGNYSLASGQTVAAGITAKSLTATVAAPGKTYDGTTTATSTLTITGGLVGTETVIATGTASFNSKDVATANLVTVNSTSLANGSNGGLAGNYSLASGETVAAHITAKALSVNGMNAANKVYDGGTAATLTGGTLNGLIGAETLAFSGPTGSFSDKNVGAHKAVTVTGITLANGTGLASNYSITNPAGLTADISRLDSVTWIGGTTGNWFDPVNWMNGAVPDLANVANVVIPGGVTASFNSGSVISPAQAGAVNVDSIGGAGGMSVAGGSLNVAGGLQLANLDQSGGALNVIGDIGVGDFSQTGGSIANTGNFTATNSFTQSGGTLNAGENVSITQASGSIVLGNIAAGGSLDVTATHGDVTQAEGTHIVVAGTRSVTAPNGNVTLADNDNHLGTSAGNDGNITKIQSAIANAGSTMSVNSNGSNIAGSFVSSGQDIFSMPNGPAGASVDGMLAGLNVTVKEQGINLPSGGQANDKTDDAD